MNVSIIFHSEEISRQLAPLKDRIAAGRGRYLRQGLIAAARVYMLWIRQRFFRASRRDGTWPDLAPSTKLKRAMKSAPGALRSRRRESGGTAQAAAAGLTFPILYDTGRLYRSLSPGGPGYIERFTGPLTLKVGSAVPYAPPHQFGVPARRLPQRVILAPPDAQAVRLMEAEILKSVDQEIADANREAATA